MMIRLFPYDGGLERHPSRRQPVNQALNTLEIREDYQTVIVPKGSPLSQIPGQAQSVREERRINISQTIFDISFENDSIVIRIF